MPDIIGTMFFAEGVGTRQAGWSESHYLIGQADDRAALTQLGLLATKRAQILGAGVTITYLRVSDINVDRDSQVAVAPAPAAMNPPVVAPAGTKLDQANQVLYNSQLRTDRGAVADPMQIFCDFPWTALLLRLEAATPFVQRRSAWLRGNPDYATSTTSDQPLPGVYFGALQTLANELVNGKYGFRGVDVSGANPLMNINSVAIAGGALTFTIKTGDPVPRVGEDIRVEGNVLLDQYGNKYKLNGKYSVAAVAGQVVTVFGQPPNLPTFTIKKPGAIRPQRKVVIPYVKAVIRRWGKKATGSPFDPLRGRSKT